MPGLLRVLCLVPSRLRDHGSMPGSSMDEARVDRWLHAVRLCPTRSAATDACRGGHVRVGARRAKPSTPVRPGDTVELITGERRRVVEVVRPIDKRVGAPVAVECYVDHSPPPPQRREQAPAGVRDKGSGRPTKRDRRQLDRLRGRR